VFTQSDQFGELKRQCGGWDKLAEKYLPYVYAAHVSSGAVPVMAVSAVGGTKVAVRDGRPMRVPDGKWLCKGLDKLAKWIGESAALMQDQKPNVPPAVNPLESSFNVARPGPPSLPTGKGSLSDQLQHNLWNVFGVVAIGLLGLAMGFYFVTPLPFPQHPAPELVSQSEPFIRDPGTPIWPGDDWKAVRGRVRNSGGEGWVRMHGIASYGDSQTDEDHKDIYLTAGEERDFELDFKKVGVLTNPQVKVKANVRP
jgi:hypothetical protein